MKHIYALLFFFCFVFISSNNQCSAQNARARNHVSFDEDWKFHFGKASDPSKDFNYVIKFKAISEGLYDGSTDIVSVAPRDIATSNELLFRVPQKTAASAHVGKILGADISFLPELEARGMKFYDKGIQKDAIEILKDHGFNYIRLRLFVNPSSDSAYSPGKGFGDLAHTMQMAQRIKKRGLKFLLDFHYSDTWADPGKQYKPSEWKGLDFMQLATKVYEYTKLVLSSLKAQGTVPDMVQTGNEINHGILWPEGSIQHPDSLAILLKAGIAAAKEIDPSIITMLHIALGGQNDESEFFLDNMINRNVSFDVIGESYYPKWHGTLQDLESNLSALKKKYNKPVIVAEYSQLKKEVNTIAFSLPGFDGKGTFIWEPLNTWEPIFDEEGRSKESINVYDEISKQYIPR